MKEDLFQLGIKGIIRNSKGEVLLLQVNKEQLNDESKSYWDIPGGRIHRGSLVDQTLKREIEEETGIKDISKIIFLAMTLSNIRIPNQLPDGNDVGLILSIYVCDTQTENNIVLSREHSEYGWFSPKKASVLLGYKYPLEFTKKVAEL